MATDFTNREIEQMFKELKDILERVEKRFDDEAVYVREEIKLLKEDVTALKVWKETIMAKFSVIVAAFGIAWVAIKEFILR